MRCFVCAHALGISGRCLYPARFEVTWLLDQGDLRLDQVQLYVAWMPASSEGSMTSPKARTAFGVAADRPMPQTKVHPSSHGNLFDADTTGAGDEARGSFNQFADSLGDKIAGRDHPLPSGNDNTGTIEQGEKEREQGRNQWNRASAEHQANKSSSTATGTAPSATTGQY